MKIFRNFCFVILLSPVVSKAQSFQPAVVVDMKGDTLHGLIDYAEWDNNPKTISFKAGPASAVQQLSPADTRFFSILAGDFVEFEAYTGPISIDHTDINHLSVGLDTTTRVDAVFLKVLQDGKNLKLFRYSDNQKVRFFIAPDFLAKPAELIYRIYLKDDETNGIDRTTFETTFKGQLYDAESKAGVMTPALKDLISKTAYKEEDLLRIVSIINGISQDDLTRTYATKTKSSHVGLAIAAAAAVLVVLVVEFSGLHSSH